MPITPAPAKAIAGTITLTHQVSQEALEYILCTAFEGGSNYWIDGGVSLPKDQKMASKHYSECLAMHGQTLAIKHAALNGTNSLQTTLLTREMLLAGLAQYLQAGGTQGILLDNEDLDCGDANDCDQVLQYALFDEIVFG